MKANNIRQYVRRLKDEKEVDTMEVSLYDKFGAFAPRQSYGNYKIDKAPKGYTNNRLVIYDMDNYPVAILRGRSKTSPELIMRDGAPNRFDAISVSGLSFPQIIKVMEENLNQHRENRIAQKVNTPPIVEEKQAEPSAKRENTIMEMKVTENTLTITVDIGQAGIKSASGKSTVIESTRGNVGIPGTDLKIGLNIYRPIR